MGEYSDLFRMANREARKAARELFAQSPIGRLARLGLGGGHPAEVAQILEALKQFGPDVHALQGMRGVSFGSLRWTVERYAKRGDDLGDLVRAWLESLGEAGKLLLELFGGGHTWMDPRRQASMLQAAINFVRAYGYEVLPPPGKGGSASELRRAAEAAWTYLQKTGETEMAEAFGAPSAKEELFQPTFELPTTGARASGGAAGPKPRAGFENLAPTHPLFTGEFVPVESSNVHSVAYDFDESTLYVRFWAKKYDKDAGDYVPTGPGPIYAYYHVPPQMFLDLLQTDSPGHWVWDKLRIRGTVFGHRFDYRLVAIAGGYVPRKATFGPLQAGNYGGEYGEIFIPRAVQLLSGKWLTSVKPYEVVRTFKPTGPIPPKAAALFGVNPGD